MYDADNLAWLSRAEAAAAAALATPAPALVWTEIEGDAGGGDAPGAPERALWSAVHPEDGTLFLVPEGEVSASDAEPAGPGLLWYAI